jgi:hypothetical protein
MSAIDLPQTLTFHVPKTDSEKHGTSTLVAHYEIIIPE